MQDTTNQLAALTAAATAQGQAYAKGEKAVFAVADDAARALGTAPTLAQWDCYSEAWKAAYAGEDSQKAWERFAALLKSRCGLDKPKSTKAKAVKVAKGREEESAKVAALAAQPRSVLAQQAKALLDEATPEALKQQALITKAIKVQNQEANKEQQAAFMTLRKEVTKAVTGLKWNAANRKTLDTIKAMLAAK